MKKKWGLAWTSALLAILMVTNAEAGRFVQKRKHADKNKDGKVTAREWRREKRQECKEKSKVDSPREKKDDTDNNGRVDRNEAAKARARCYLRRRSTTDRAWEKEADENSDGKVDGKELQTYRKSKLDTDDNGEITAAERRAYWLKKKAVVNTKTEKKYDKDKDGYLTGEEAREMMKDMLRIVNTKGKAKVNTDIEREFDVNNDSVIDRKEAKALRKALSESSN